MCLDDFQTSIEAGFHSKLSQIQGKKKSEKTQVLLANVNKELSEKATIENKVIIREVGAGGRDEHDTNKDQDWTGRKRRDGSNMDMIVVELKCEAGRQAALREARMLKDLSLRNIGGARMLKMVWRTSRPKKKGKN
ncbi:hypothetical protein BpHYR1_002345 [Brachionus plicatilis]|uniref:Uncharacterized protein n=1 Tax=Brachionus plicatilis TaxID=10195 RepID=A0A3M7Q1J7_BRAPC|nr:hypothetical protein BpHYR1_002345 [Brachionus plicatilis]